MNDEITEGNIWAPDTMGPYLDRCAPIDSFDRPFGWASHPYLVFNLD